MKLEISISFRGNVLIIVVILFFCVYLFVVLFYICDFEFGDSILSLFLLIKYLGLRRRLVLYVMVVCDLFDCNVWVVRYMVYKLDE